MMAVATKQLIPEHPLRDTALEEAFGRHGVEAWSFEPNIAIDAVDRERSLANQARLEPLNEDVVARYAEDMANGDVFPAIVVERRRTSRGVRYVVIGGNHRVAAARMAKRTSLAGYVVEGDSTVLYRLMWEDNRRHGFAPSDAERKMAAVHLVDQSDTMAEAARTVGLAYHKLTEHFAVINADKRAQRPRIPSWPRLPQLSRKRLGTLTGDRLFKASIDAVMRHGLATTDVSELVVKLNGAENEDAALAMLAEADADLAMAGLAAAAPAGRGKQSPRRVMMEALRSIRYLSASKVVADCADDDQRKVLASSIRDAAAVLQQVLRGVG